MISKAEKKTRTGKTPYSCLHNSALKYLAKILAFVYAYLYVCICVCETRAASVLLAGEQIQSTFVKYCLRISLIPFVCLPGFPS